MELEKVKSHSALQGFKPLWRIMKSIQLKYLPTPPEDVAVRLGRMLDILEIRDVEQSAFSEEEAVKLLTSFGITCSIDPDSFGN